MGAAAIVVTEADVDPQPLADELGRRMWARRERLAGRLMDIDTALRSAADGPGPVLLLDMGDNVGGGSPGDSAYIAHALRRHQLGGGLMTLYDPASVRAARAAGAGATCALDLGGATDPRCGGPLHARAEVVGLFSGTFTESQVRHGGMTHFDMGDTAVVRTPEDTTFMLTSRRLFPVSAAQWTAFGIDPSRYRFIVAKGVHAPVAAYREICPRMFRVNTPGVTSADVQTFSYRYRRRPMYPFEAGAAWD